MGKSWTKRNVLIAAALVGIITGLIVWNYLPRGRPLAETAVATVAVSRGELITRDMVTLKAIARHGQSTLSSEAVVGKIALANIEKGDRFQLDKLGPKGLSAEVPAGMRAVSVGVDAVINVAGFVQPGDHVDVVATYNRGDSAYSETILQNVELLAVGQKIKAGERETVQQERKTATLIVTPDQAQLVTLAENQGKLRLVLRNPNDVVHEQLQETTSRVPVTVKETPRTIYPTPHVPTTERVLPPQSVTQLIQHNAEIVPEQPPTVEVIRGNVRTQEVVSID
ncbi:MAG: Flp pilus assembly protein CpaB [Armatimonadota bacterium]